MGGGTTLRQAKSRARIELEQTALENNTRERNDR
jgi:hypothetical protein